MSYCFANVASDIIASVKGIRKVKRIRNSSGHMSVEARVVDKAFSVDKLTKKVVFLELSYVVELETYTKIIELVNLSFSHNKGDSITVLYEKGYPQSAILLYDKEEESFKNVIRINISYLLVILISVVLFIFI